MENKVDLLEMEIIRLNKIIDKYKFKIGIRMIGQQKDFEEFNEFQEKQRQNTIKSLEESKDKEVLEKEYRE